MEISPPLETKMLFLPRKDLSSTALVLFSLYMWDLGNVTHTLFAAQVLSDHLVFTA